MLTSMDEAIATPGRKARKQKKVRYCSRKRTYGWQSQAGG